MTPFAALVDGSIGRLYAVAALILRDPDRAQDAVQEAYVAAWRDIRGLRDPDALDAWLRRLVVRACYRQVRADRRRSVVELRVVPAEAPTSPGHELTIAERDRLARGFARLGPEQPAIIVLHHYLDLALAEVAATPSRSARPSPGSAGRPPPCAPPSRRTSAPSCSRRDARHERPSLPRAPPRPLARDRGPAPAAGRPP